MSFLQEKFGFSVVRFRRHDQSRFAEISRATAFNSRKYDDPLQPKVHSEEPEYSESVVELSSQIAGSLYRHTLHDIGWKDSRQSFYDTLQASEVSSEVESRQRSAETTAMIRDTLLSQCQQQNKLQCLRNSSIFKVSKEGKKIPENACGAQQISLSLISDTSEHEVDEGAFTVRGSARMGSESHGHWRRSALSCHRRDFPAQLDKDDDLIKVCWHHFCCIHMVLYDLTLSYPLHFIDISSAPSLRDFACLPSHSNTLLLPIIFDH
jgi:hypothetical protein